MFCRAKTTAGKRCKFMGPFDGYCGKHAKARGVETDPQAAYLRTVFTRDSPFPHGDHAGTPIRDLPDVYLAEVIGRGLKHSQLYMLIVREQEMRATTLQIGGGC